MKSAVDQTKEDLKHKLRLEKELLAALLLLNEELATRAAASFKNNNTVYDPAAMEDDYRGMLAAHYGKTQAAFDNVLGKQMPDDVAVTPDERKTIEGALAVHLAHHAAEQARLITETNRKDVRDAVIQAQSDRNAEGQPFSHEEQAHATGVYVRRALQARQQTIAQTETQYAAEVSKQTEAEVLVGDEPSIAQGVTPKKSDVMKEWVTVGDEKVRHIHADADFQKVPSNSLYTVGGEKLMFPGDWSHGATPGNIMNCRCSSVINGKDVYAIRHAKGQAPVVETAPNPQLSTSIGL